MLISLATVLYEKSCNFSQSAVGSVNCKLTAGVVEYFDPVYRPVVLSFSEQFQIVVIIFLILAYDQDKITIHPKK